MRLPLALGSDALLEGLVQAPPSEQGVEKRGPGYRSRKRSGLWPDHVLLEVRVSLELSLIIALIAHFVGDYIIQNQTMADQKTSKWSYALLHGFTYTLPFLFATQSLAALLVIALTHAVIDRYRLAKYLIWFKNQLVPKKNRYAWDDSITRKNGDFNIRLPHQLNDKATGFPQSVPPWMSVWLLIIVDNTLHIVINTLAIIFLGHVGVMW